MNEVATNLVPYPRLHYIFSSISPITLAAPNMCTMQGTKYVSPYSLSFTLKYRFDIGEIYPYQYLRLQDELFTAVWSRNNQLIKLDPLQRTSVILAAAHIARGNTTLTDIKRNIERYLIILF